LEQLGQAQRAARSPDAGERARGAEETQRLQREMDVRETGTDSSPRKQVVTEARAQIRRQLEGLSKEEFRAAVKAEMAELREASRRQSGWTPEQRARFEELADLNNLRNWKEMGQAGRGFGEGLREIHEQGLAEGREMLEAGSVVRSLMPGLKGEIDQRIEMRKRGAAWPESRDVREQRMLEQQAEVTRKSGAKMSESGPQKPEWMPQEDFDGLAKMAKTAGVPLQEL